MAYPRENPGSIFLDLHPPATAKPLLPPPQFPVQKYLINSQTSGHSGKEGHQGFTMGLAGSVITEHEIQASVESLIVNEALARAANVIARQWPPPVQPRHPKFREPAIQKLQEVRNENNFSRHPVVVHHSSCPNRPYPTDFRPAE